MTYKRLSTVTEFEQEKLEETIKVSLHIGIKDLMNIPLGMLTTDILKRIVVIGEDLCITYLFHQGLLKGDVERELYLTRRTDFSNLIEINLDLYSERIKLERKDFEIDYKYVTKDNITEYLLGIKYNWGPEILNSDRVFNIYLNTGSTKLLDYVESRDLGEEELKKIIYKDSINIVKAGNFHPYLLQVDSVKFDLPLGDKYNKREYYREVLRFARYYRMAKYSYPYYSYTLPADTEIDLLDFIKIIKDVSNRHTLYDNYSEKDFQVNMENLFSILASEDCIILYNYLISKYPLLYEELREKYPFWIIFKKEITKSDINFFINKNYAQFKSPAFSGVLNFFEKKIDKELNLTAGETIIFLDSFTSVFSNYNVLPILSNVFIKKRLSMEELTSLFNLRSNTYVSTSFIKTIYPGIFSDLKEYWKESPDNSVLHSILKQLNKTDLNNIISLHKDSFDKILDYIGYGLELSIPVKKIMSLTREQILKLAEYKGLYFQGDLDGAAKYIIEAISPEDTSRILKSSFNILSRFQISNSTVDKFGIENVKKLLLRFHMSLSTDLDVKYILNLRSDSLVIVAPENYKSFIELINAGDIEYLKRVSKRIRIPFNLIHIQRDLYEAILPYLNDNSTSFSYIFNSFLGETYYSAVLREFPALICLLERDFASKFLDIPGVSDYIPKSWGKLKTLCDSSENILLSTITFLDTNLKSEVSSVVCQRCQKEFLISLLSDDMILYKVKTVSREDTDQKCSCCE